MPVLVTFLPMILAAAAGIMTFRRLPLAFRLVLAEILFSLAVQALSVYWSHAAPFGSKRTVWLYNLYALPDFWLQAATAFLLLRSRMADRLLAGALALHLGIWAASIQMGGWQALANNAYLAASVILTAAYLGIAVQLVSRSEERSLLRHPAFLLCWSVILYHCCSIPYVALFNVLTTRYPALAGKLHSLLEILDALRVLICGICFLLYFFRRNPPHPLPD